MSDEESIKNLENILEQRNQKFAFEHPEEHQLYLSVRQGYSDLRKRNSANSAELGGLLESAGKIYLADSSFYPGLLLSNHVRLSLISLSSNCFTDELKAGEKDNLDIHLANIKNLLVAAEETVDELAGWVGQVGSDDMDSYVLGAYIDVATMHKLVGDFIAKNWKNEESREFLGKAGLDNPLVYYQTAKNYHEMIVGKKIFKEQAARFLFESADISQKMGHSQESLELFKQVQEITPDYPGLQERLKEFDAMAFDRSVFQQEKYQKIVNAFNQDLVEEGKTLCENLLSEQLSYDEFFWLGEALRGNRLYEKSALAFEKAAAVEDEPIKKKMALAYAGLSHMKFSHIIEMQDQETARQHYELAKDLFIKGSEGRCESESALIAQVELISVYTSLGQYEQAVKHGKSFMQNLFVMKHVDREIFEQFNFNFTKAIQLNNRYNGGGLMLPGRDF